MQPLKVHPLKLYNRRQSAGLVNTILYILLILTYPACFPVSNVVKWSVALFNRDAFVYSVDPVRWLMGLW